MRHRLILALLLVGFAGPAFGQSRVQFELATEKGFPITATREWVRLFQGFPATRVQVRSARSGERESVERIGEGQQSSFRVVGLLTRRNRLRLPGAREFNPSERTSIEKWIGELRAKGLPSEQATQLAFGLQEVELVAFHERLAEAIGFDTKGQRAGDVARRIVKGLAVEFDVTAEARRAFARDEPVGDELNGLSAGTALAAVLRPLGLALAPRKRVSVELLIADADELEEWWPIGWPRQQAPYKTAPELFKYLPVTIKDQTLQTSLDAIQQRVKTPFLFDHNALARQNIDPKGVKVSFSKSRTPYKRIVDNLLFQAKLKSEIRIDDAGSPFLWITTSRPPSPPSPRPSPP